MLEAIVIIVALGGLEVILWLADHRRQKAQLDTLEAIWAELATLNEHQERSLQQSALPSQVAPPTELPAAN